MYSQQRRDCAATSLAIQ